MTNGRNKTNISTSTPGQSEPSNDIEKLTKALVITIIVFSPILNSGVENQL